MINRDFAILKHLVGFLAVGGLIASQWAYAQESGKEAAPPAQAAMESAAEPTPDEIRRGQDLFDGKVRFAGKGVSCNACHHVHHDAILGGATLSTDLTLAFSRMGKEGLRAILGNAPFPAMQAAYEGKALTADEIHALAGFLQHADKQQQTSDRQPIDVGLRMFGAGAAGVVVLLGFFSLIGRRRKKRSVNQDIFDRQVKSE